MHGHTDYRHLIFYRSEDELMQNCILQVQQIYYTYDPNLFTIVIFQAT